MRFVTVDVFTEQPFCGNPLAVVLEADGCSEARMQAIAAEFGYSETAFVCSPTRPGFDARVRIFTPTTELGFAGHPTIGTALVLSEGDRTLRLELGAGPVDVEVRGGSAQLQAPQRFARLGSADREDVAAACGLDPAAIMGDPVAATCGTAFVVAETDALARARPIRHVGHPGVVGVLLYTPGDPIRARVFAPAAGVPEDPATGSAALVLAGLLADCGGPGAWIVEQGAQLGRPSRLSIRADGAGRTWLEGTAVEMMRGTLSLGG